METISFEDFKKIDVRIGRIISAERVEGSDKLLKLEVDFGLEAGKRQILCPDDSGSPVLMHPDKEIPPGSAVK